MDAKVGGTYEMLFTNFSTGESHSFGGTYRELVPHERVCYTDAFDDPNLPGEMLTTVTLKKVAAPSSRWCRKECPKSFPPRRAISVGKSRSSFLRTVEPEIPDGM